MQMICWALNQNKYLKNFPVPKISLFLRISLFYIIIQTSWTTRTENCLYTSKERNAFLFFVLFCVEARKNNRS